MILDEEGRDSQGDAAYQHLYPHREKTVHLGGDVFYRHIADSNAGRCQDDIGEPDTGPVTRAAQQPRKRDHKYTGEADHQTNPAGFRQPFAKPDHAQHRSQQGLRVGNDRGEPGRYEFRSMKHAQITKACRTDANNTQRDPYSQSTWKWATQQYGK